MQITKGINEYLVGKEFSNALHFEVKDVTKKKRLSRIEMLEKLVENKKVIHVGACDHVPLIEKKIKENVWLHKRLKKSTDKIIGIDINEEAVKFVNQIGYYDIYYKDMLMESEEIFGKMNELYVGKWDYLVLGEMLEHVNNPIEFLEKISILYKEKVKGIIITVPNAFAYNSITLLKRNIELNNSDHKYVFTPYTILKVITMAGIIPKEIYFAGYPSFKRRLVFPWLDREIMALSIVAVAEF